MEFNVFEYFKDYKRTTNGPMTPEEQGTSLFLAGNMGERIREFADVAAVNTLGRLVAFWTACLGGRGLNEDGSGGGARLDALQRQVCWIQTENRQ